MLALERNYKVTMLECRLRAAALPISGSEMIELTLVA